MHCIRLTPSELVQCKGSCIQMERECRRRGKTGREVYLAVARVLGAKHALYLKCGHLHRYALIRRKICLLKLLRIETPRAETWIFKRIHDLAVLLHVRPQVLHHENHAESA